MKRLVLAALLAGACGSDDPSNVDGEDGALADAASDGVPPVVDGPPGGAPGSLRFYNSHTPGADRVEIRLDPHVPADVGMGSFTIDLWFRVFAGAQLPTTCQTGRDGWMSGAIILDRDRASDGPHGEFGLSVFENGDAFGLSQGGVGVGICGSEPLRTGWHHVAITRDATSRQVVLYLDGMPNGSATGPAGDVSYQDGATGAAKDPFLVIGADKHEAAGRNGLDGFVDELRISTTVRWTAAFERPLMPHTVDPDTAALYHFNDAGGATLTDERGMSPGEIKFGLDATMNAVPLWVTSEPFLN